MKAVADLIRREPLSSVTVRRIADETGCSHGQIHHHFASAADLRAEAVLSVWNCLEPQLVEALQHLSARDRLLTVLCGPSTSLPPDVSRLVEIAERLWKEAWDIRKEAPVRVAVCFGLGKMCDEVISTLTNGVKKGAFAAGLQIGAVADRLMSASHGYDLLAETSVFGANPDNLAFMEGVFQKEGI